MPNYADAKIYTIRSRSNDTLIYIGSTTQKLTQRLAKHRSDCKYGINYSLYDYIVNDDWSDFYIELYEKYPCNDKAELCKREGEIIRQIGTINKYIAGRTKKEWCEDNADKVKGKQKEWREKNADKVKGKQKEWREKNADKIKECKKEYYENNVEKFKEKNKKYYNDNVEKIKEYIKEWCEKNAEKVKEYHKEYSKKNAEKLKGYSKEYYENNAEKIKKYYENNAEKINERNNKYYENNADKINEKRKEKICCDICGAFMSKNGLTRHQKTKKCTDIASKSKN